MTVCQASEQLLETVNSHPDFSNDILNNEVLLISNSSFSIYHLELAAQTLCVGVARVGWPDRKIVVSTLGEMISNDLGPPLHSLVIVGKVHPLELDYLRMFNPDIVS